MAEKKATKKAPAKAKVRKSITKKTTASKATAGKKAASKKSAVRKSATTRKTKTAKKIAAGKKTAPQKKTQAAKKAQLKKQAAAPSATVSSGATIPVKPPEESSSVELEPSKYQAPQPSDFARPPQRQPALELPEEYGDTRLILLPRDPEWVFAYWEINQQIRNALDIPRRQHNRRMVIRAYDITGLEEFTGVNALSQFDIEINDFASSWYIRTGLPNRSWCADLGLLNDDEEFIQITRSNTVYSPANDLSEISQEQWMSPGAEVERALGLPVGILRELAKSEELGQRLAQRLASESLQAPGAASDQRFPGASELARRPFPQQREFWLMINTELIVYGSTEPTATVTIQGQEATVQPDGAFSVRFALPDGRQTIPIEAVAQNGKQSRKTVMIIEKKSE